MTQTQTIAQQRLYNQQVTHQRFTTPGEVVHWLGAVQAQDYLAALWAVGLRLPDASEALIEQALAAKELVRTWPMRGTIHFVAPTDIHWMLEVLTPRVTQRHQSRLRELGLDATILAASADVLAKALQGGKQLTRPEIYQLLEAADIAASGSRGLHILSQLAHERVLCFGARRGKQPTFTLLDEWVPQTRSLPRDEALATLALRYATSHGPATSTDFGWWAGLSAGEAKTALATVAGQLGQTVIDGQVYYHGPELPASQPAPGTVCLLPPFDEFLVAYRDRTAALDPQYATMVVPGGNGIFNPIVVLDGQVLGTWKRTFKQQKVVMACSAFRDWANMQPTALAAAAERYARFVGKSLVME